MPVFLLRASLVSKTAILERELRERYPALFPISKTPHPHISMIMTSCAGKPIETDIFNTNRRIKTGISPAKNSLELTPV